MDPAFEIPNDVALLKALLLEKDQRIRHLEHENQLLFKIAFGPTSEKRPPMPTGMTPQMEICLEGITAEAARLSKEHGVVATVEVSPPSPKKGRRKTFADHLPVARVVCELPEDQRQCDCGGKLEEFAQEETRELERIETAVVHVIVRKKYSCRKC